MNFVDVFEVILRIVLFGSITIQCIRYRKYEMSVSAKAFGLWGTSALLFTMSFFSANEYIISATGSLLTGSLCYLLLTWKVRR